MKKSKADVIFEARTRTLTIERDRYMIALHILLNCPEQMFKVRIPKSEWSAIVMRPWAADGGILALTWKPRGKHKGSGSTDFYNLEDWLRDSHHNENVPYTLVAEIGEVTQREIANH